MTNDPKETLVNLGFSSSHAESILNSVQIDGGLTIVSGVANSGKTTTLMALRQIVESHNKSVTKKNDLELLAPDEIRDSASVEAYAQAAKLGKKMLAKIHANSAISAIKRLRLFEQGMKFQLPAIHVSLSIYQALLPRPCSSCAFGFEQFNLIDQKHEYLNRTKLAITSRFTESERQKLLFRNHAGCTNCTNGTSGFSVVAEVVVPSQKLIELIKSGNSTINSEPHNLIVDHALEKSLLGQVDLCDVAVKLGLWI